MNINQPSGKFLKIIHRVNDSLFLMGSKKIPSPLIQTIKINEIQNEDINKIVKSLENNFLINLSENNFSTEEKIEDQDQKVSLAASQNQDNILQEKDSNLEYVINSTNEIKTDVDSSKLQKINYESLGETNLKEEENQQITDLNLSQEENDKNIISIFLTLLKLYFKDNKELFPLDPGKLLKEYMKPLSAEMNIVFDFKNSSFKKINSFLKFMQKDKNLITFGKPKGLQNDFIISVIWEHPLIIDYIPIIKKIKFVDLQVSEDEKDNLILQKDEKIEVSQLFKPNQKVKIIFELSDKNFDSSKYYPLKYCNEILTLYLKDNNLFLKGGLVRLNSEIKSCLIKSDKTDSSISVKNLIDLSETYKMEEILNLWKKNLNEKSFITKTNSEQEQTVLSNNSLKVKIYAKKFNNKNVTVIDGLQNFTNIKDVIKIFSKHFACSVTIKEFQNSKEAVFIQGYWVSELVTLLQDEIKLNKQFIQVEDKLNLKTKKK
jgi:translation initiation factor 1 (eIF-1/SUI1)